MARVKWLSIGLKGFGRYRSGVQVQLTDGLNILTAPNEAGKSTLVAGLRAVLFGLPSSSNPNQFGTDRYRCWEEAGAFEGEVVFAVDDRRYRVKRNFQNHRVELAQEKAGEWEVLFRGEHNPRAHKDAGVYAGYLKELIGITTGEAFAGTFCVEQPLPEGDQLSEHVQSLLSGSGGHFGQALEQLKNELSQITRFLKQYGFPRDGTKDRALEELEQQLQALREEIRAGEEAVDRLQSVLKARAEVEKELERTGKTLTQKKRLKEAWSQARQLQERYREILSRQLELKEAEDRLQRLEDTLEREQRELEDNYPAFLQAPAELAEALERITGLEQEQERLETEISRVQKALAERQEELAALEGQLAGLAVFDEKPHLLADFREYRRLQQEYETLRENLQELKREQEKALAELAGLPAWGLLGNHPLTELDNLVPAAQRFLRLWQKEENGRRELAAVREKLATQYACFQDLSQEQEEALADYRALLVVLETKAKEKERAYREAAAEQERQEQARAADRKRKSFLITAGLVLLAAVLGWLAGGGKGLLVGALGGAAAGGALAVVVRGQKPGRLPEEAEKLAGLAREMETARQALADFHALLKEQESAFGDALPQAFGAFKVLRQQEEDLQAALAQVREDLDAVDWQKLARLGGILGQAVQDLPQLARWLAGMDEETWQEARRSCRRWEELQERLTALQRKAEELESLPADFQEKLAGLREQVFPYDLDTPLAVVEEDALRYRRCREAKSGLTTTMATLQEDLQGLCARKEEVAAELASLREKYWGYLEAGGGEARAARHLWQQFQQKRQRLQQLAGERQGLLAGVAVEDSRELAQKLQEADNQARLVLAQLEELARQHPGLPSLAQETRWQELEKEYRQLEEEIEGLTRQEEELKRRDQELRRQQGYLEGQQPVNIALGLEQLADLEERRRTLTLEAEALGIAYQELKKAIEDYNASYRERLAERATHYFRLFTGTRREVLVTEDFSVKVRDDGQERTPGQFSQGTRDQLFLALRLAIGDLLAEDVPLPFIFDDPFLNYDAQRFTVVMDLLRSLARERQIFCLSHRQDMQAWGVPVAVKEWS